MFDIVVVGSGPGGSAVAKRCAGHGLRTLLLEKRRLPRDKICSGMVMSHLAQALVEKEFGQIPQEVLTTPHHLSGLVLYVVGVGSRKVEHKMPLTWRRDLDYWMNQKAQGVGVEVWDSARVTGVTEAGDGYVVTLGGGKREQEVRARFVVGADGATSAVRRSLFPDLKVQYGQVIQEYYQGTLDLEREYFYFGYFPEIPVAPSFSAHHKQDLFIVDAGAMVGELKSLNLFYRAKEALAEEHGFDLKQQPLWRGGCCQLSMYEEIVSGTFSPCKGNILLVGEAAGLMMPFVTGDGIGEAIWSGLLAANSIIKAIEAGEEAERFYISEIANIISMYKTVYYPLLRKIIEQAKKDGQHLLGALEEAWGKTLNIDVGDLSTLTYKMT